jgi:cell division protein FtsB
MEWWGVALCLIVLALVHGHSAEAHEQELAALQLQLLQLQADMTSLRVVNESLTLQINSQSDPEYVELVLRKGLGLVPEGQTKVYFAPQEQGI